MGETTTTTTTTGHRIDNMENNERMNEQKKKNNKSIFIILISYYHVHLNHVVHILNCGIRFSFFFFIQFVLMCSFLVFLIWISDALQKMKLKRKTHSNAIFIALRQNISVNLLAVLFVAKRARVCASAPYLKLLWVFVWVFF